LITSQRSSHPTKTLQELEEKECYVCNLFSNGSEKGDEGEGDEAIITFVNLLIK
jgi:hypothetical protein